MKNLNQKMPRYKAEYKGDTLGWYDTLSEAEAAIEAAINEEANETAEWLRQIP